MARLNKKVFAEPERRSFVTELWPVVAHIDLPNAICQDTCVDFCLLVVIDAT